MSKPFFVIKGEPNRWFDQDGKEVPNLTALLPDFSATGASGCKLELDTPGKPPLIWLAFRVAEIKSVSEISPLLRAGEK